LKKIADHIDAVCEKWEMTSELSITGGEPFSRKTDLFYLLEHLETKSNIIRIDILSNGLLITSEDIEKLKQIKKLNSIQISLDGHNLELHEFIRGNDTFERTIESIKMLKTANIKTSIMMTLSKSNYMYIHNMYNLLKSLKVDYFAVDRFVPENIDVFGFNKNMLSKEELESAYEEVGKLFIDNNGLPKLLPYRPLFCLLNKPGSNQLGAACSAGHSSLTILPDGTALPCRRLPVPIGNVLHDSIYKIWYGNKLLWDLRNRHLLTGKCGSCDHALNCKGCRATAYAVHGNYLMEDPLCWKK
jgi:AdoMet-dependent heme synthase